MKNGDLLGRIMMHLEDTQPWTLASKRLRAVSKDTLWRAKWFMQRYERYEVIFYAIARAKIFTDDLFKKLVELGAPLSRNLVQLLYYMRDPLWRQKLLQVSKVMTQWARNIRDSAHVAVLNRAVELVSIEL